MATMAAVLPYSTGFCSDSATRPNIVLIMADDLGWADVGYHGGEIKTPNIDCLAKEGVRLEQFYVQPVCSPTRSALLTGRYPMRYGLQVGVVRPWADYGPPLDERTLAQALQGAGYFTGMCGKWHLGLIERGYLPTERGFDHQYGHYNGAIDYFTHHRDGGLDWHRNDQPLREEGYSTDLLADEAVRLIERHDASKPLFLYVPFNAVHTPLQAPDEYIERYSHVTDRKRRIYAAMTTCMDAAIGRIVAAVDDKGIREKTLIVFCSDNGGPEQHGADNGPYRGQKGTLYEGGVRVPCIAKWPGTLKAGEVYPEPLHIVDWYPTLLRLAGVTAQSEPALDGRDLWPALAEGRSSPDREILHNLTPTGGAIRVGDWKLVVSEGGRGRKKGRLRTVELFNIAEDPYETTNQAAEQSQKVRELRARLDAYAKAAVPPKGRPGGPPDHYEAPKVWAPGQ